ncbi:MAG TPA: tol-pal system-associated acyl-CoA thioesterase [Methylocystis sp.]|nr:tol-pal system-associated acyl-CoA thioesterase [Methylocystis sp.]
MGAHKLPVRVYYEDTDFSGFVYHASYLRFMERGRTELLRELGLLQRDLALSEPTGALFFVVSAMEIDFRQPAHMDELLSVETRLETIGGASLKMRQEIRRGDALLSAARVTVALVLNGKPQRISAAMREKFERLLAR